MSSTTPDIRAIDFGSLSWEETAPAGGAPAANGPELSPRETAEGIDRRRVYTAADLDGVTHLGAIRSLATSCSVLGSALGPVIVGSLLDRGATIESVCLGFGGWCVVTTGLLAVALAAPPAPAPGGRA